MLLPYNSDQCVEFRPWTAYVMFPLCIVSSFYLIVQGVIPETNRMMFIDLADIAGLIVFVQMIVSFFYLWTLGRAVCSKIGNSLYLTVIAICLAIGAGVYNLLLSINPDYTIWLLSWMVHWFAGMFFFYFPLNSVDFFIVLPPFRTITLRGLTTIILWLIADLMFCVCLGWIAAVFVHLISFFLGITAASILRKVPYLSFDVGDKTLLQWIKGDAKEEELAWKDSWSNKKKQREAEDVKLVETDQELRDKEKELDSRPNLQEEQKVLCECGSIVKILPAAESKQIKCEFCGRYVKAKNL